ncbi:MAG: helix-turn-helix domain-containing protein [Candidatus Promineifilaceae bacterium]
MSDIATAAGVGRATLYRHFESCEALIEKLILIRAFCKSRGVTSLC